MDIHRAPIACRIRGSHLFVEGESSGVEDDDILEEAVSRFGHLLTREPVTGFEWLRAIANEVSRDTLAHNDQLIQGLRRIMQCDRFNGVCYPSREARVAKAMNQMAALGGEGHIQLYQRQEPASAALAALLDVPESHCVVLHDQASLLGRIQRLLEVRPVGPQLFSQEQGDDEEAQLAVVSLLIKNHGYGSMVAERSPGQTWEQFLEPPKAVNLFDALGPRVAVEEFFQLLVRSGWDGSGSVYMSRRAPAFNPLASVQPYESLVHHKVIGWRLPQEMVDRQTLAARAVIESTNQALSRRSRRSMAEG